MSRELIVLKFGGSVLASEEDLRTAVHEIYRYRRDGYAVVAVVSALEGTTDALIERAEVYGAEDPAARAMLLATGEFTTASLLALALKRSGLPSLLLSPGGAGLRTEGEPLNSTPQKLNAAAVGRGLEEFGVVVIPGFVGVRPEGGFSLLGRGGSDLSAIFIAGEMRNAGWDVRCRLIKDVDGLYTWDPALPGPAPERYLTASWQRVAGLGGGIVQARGVDSARGRQLAFEVGSFDRNEATLVGALTDVSQKMRVAERPLSVVLLGCGTVGAGVYHLLARLPKHFIVQRVAVRDVKKAAQEGVPAELLTTDVRAAAAEKSDVVVELVGGVELPRELVLAAIAGGAEVVTANKALMAAHGEEIRAAAKSRGVVLRCSAAVGGSVPMIETVSRLANLGVIQRIEGVVNGTTNFVLGLVDKGQSFQDAVKEAQRLGYAEADPSRDLNGTDAAEKLVVLAQAGFGVGERVDQLQVEGLDAAAIDRLKPSGSRVVVRHLAWLERSADGVVRGGVKPTIVDADGPFGVLPGPENCLVVRLASGESTRVRGSGAGRWPTSESVMADLLELRRNRFGVPEDKAVNRAE